MRCVVESFDNNHVKVCLEGSLSDGQTFPGIKKTLMGLHSEGKIYQIVDLRNCDELDEMVFSALLIANRICNKSGGSFKLVGINQSMRECIHRFGLEQAFETE